MISVGLFALLIMASVVAGIVLLLWRGPHDR